MKKKRIIRVLTLAVVAAAIIGFVLIKKGKSATMKYQFEVLAQGDIESVVATNGMMNPIDTVDIGSQVSGKIIKLHADFNSQVKAGQIMAELDQEPLQTNVNSNKANYESLLASLEKARLTLGIAQKKYERTLDLFQHNLVSVEEKEAAEATYVSAKLGLQIAEEGVSQAKLEFDLSKVNLSYAIIRSPIDGTVITRAVNVGQTVAAGYQTPVLFQIASNLKKMQVQCNVDETDIGRVKEGQMARFTVEAFKEEEFSGTVLRSATPPP